MKQKYVFLDYARVAACMAVVSIHTISSNVASMTKVPFFIWWIDSIIDAMVVWVVPLFVMISGALLLGRQERVGTFFRKRFLSVIIPTIFWVIIYFFLFSIIRGATYTPQSIISALIFDQPLENLYFLFIISELYIITPFLRRFLAQKRRKDVLRIGLLFLVIGIFWRYQQFVGTMFIPYMGYYILGYYLRDVTISNKQRKLLIVSFILNVTAISVGTYLFASHIVYNLNDDFYFYRHTNIFVVFLSITVFLLFKGFEQYLIKQKRLSALIEELKPKTLGIFIIHWPLRVILFYLLFSTREIIYPIPLWFQPILYIFLFVASYGITKVILQIALIKYVV